MGAGIAHVAPNIKHTHTYYLVGTPRYLPNEQSCDRFKGFNLHIQIKLL